MIQLRLNQQLGDITLSVDQSIPSKGITAIFGRSGSGKTSLINAIAGLLCPDSGRIVIKKQVLFDDEQRINVPIEARQIGYVFQDARLFPHYSVAGNLRYGMSGNLDTINFDHIVDLLNLSSLLDRHPIDLSGGEKQRVAIARALLSKPAILLMDEPLASLDLPRKQEVMPFLERLANDINIPILYVTHSISEMMRLADHILLLESGRVIASGPLEAVWSSEAMQPWQSSSGKSSLFEATLSEHHPQYALSKVSLSGCTDLWVQRVEAPLNSRIRLQIRANDVSISLNRATDTSIRNILPATIDSIEQKKSDTGQQSVAIRLALATECYLWATITQWAYDELELTQGMAVYAQVKGVSVTPKDMALKPLGAINLA
jgi:molybdate transport system ATP-binding protein